MPRTPQCSRWPGELQTQVKAERFKAAKGLLARARTRDSTQALGKLTTVADRRRRIISAPPMIVPVEDVFADVQATSSSPGPARTARQRL